MKENCNNYLKIDGLHQTGMRKVDEIILHCTATREGQAVTVDQVRQWHTLPVGKGGRGWRDIGYHYLVGLDGTVWPGRPLALAGAHCMGHNQRSIGVCYVGGLGKDGKPKDTRTPAQKAALVRLVEELRDAFGIPRSGVHGHNEFACKACPCFDVYTEFRKDL